jgi:asparagine synthase (glutamine-hydrolysing)
MCGICGEFGRIKLARVQSMAASLLHRGPDDSGFYEEESICLGMRRLSIIDLEGGQQPMTNEDRSVAVVFNGEIYNYKEIRRSLIERGHRFKSRSDTEVIVHLYEEKGEDFLKYLRGMFAIALWDSKEKRLILARDRLGIKPLYFVRSGTVLAFASEIRALVKVGHAPLEADPVAIAQYVGFPCIPTPRAAVRNIEALKPAEMVVINEKSVRSEYYWNLSFPEVKKENDPAKEEYYSTVLREKMEEAVRIRLESDVALGAFLSGGLDSSTVVALMSSCQSSAVHTFSLSFKGTEKEFSQFDEQPFAKLIAKFFETNHTEIKLSGSDLRKRLLRIIWAMDQPSGDALQHYLVSEVAKTGVTVALSGTGADEVFAGYELFREMVLLERAARVIGLVPPFWKMRLAQWIATLPKKLSTHIPIRKLKSLINVESDFLSRYRLNRRFYNGEELAALLQPRIWEALVSAGEEADELAEYKMRIRGTSVISATSLLQLKTDMVNLLLRDQDAVSMAHSLEVRLPFIDHEVLEFAAAIPSSLKLHGRIPKFILKRSMADILPQRILQRQKRGFFFPMHLWMRNDLEDVVRNTLSMSSINKRGFFNYEPVAQLKEAFFAGKEPFFKVWNLVVLELWCRLVLDHKVFDDPGLRPIEDLL